MSKSIKSAKDIAFDKERDKFRSTIKDLQEEIISKNRQIKDLTDMILKKDDIIASKDDWIRRLLEYTELSEEDLREFKKDQENRSQVLEILNKMSTLYSFLR